MNKTTKIALNYGIGIAIMVVLFWSLYHQVSRQLSDIGDYNWWPTDTLPYLIVALLFIPLNLGIEARKWQLLAQTAEPITYLQAVKSLFGGIAFSLITPNRIGEYPGRILFLQQKNSTRLISVSILGGCAQLLAVLIAGVAGLIYYNIYFPGLWQALTLAGCIILAAITGAFYSRFEHWAPYIERIRWLRRFHMYGQLLGRFSGKEQAMILGMSLLRLLVFTTQYFCMLRWMHVDIPAFDGFFLCMLFFWAMAVIPSIALAELGIRGEVSLFLFHTFSANKIGMLTATMGLWCINLVVPALLGSILLLRLKLLR